MEDTIPKIYSYSDQRRNEFGLYGPDGFLYDTSLIFPPQDESFNVKFLLSGLWEVNKFRLSKLVNEQIIIWKIKEKIK